MALAAYRNLLRASQIAFHGDSRMLLAARYQIRQNFRENASMSDSEVEPAIQKAYEVAQILRKNVLQGKKEGGDNLYKLRIHDEIERGDNDSVKKINDDPATKLGGKCSPEA